MANSQSPILWATFGVGKSSGYDLLGANFDVPSAQGIWAAADEALGEQSARQGRGYWRRGGHDLESGQPYIVLMRSYEDLTLSRNGGCITDLLLIPREVALQTDTLDAHYLALAENPQIQQRFQEERKVFPLKVFPLMDLPLSLCLDVLDRIIDGQQAVEVYGLQVYEALVASIWKCLPPPLRLVFRFAVKRSHDSLPKGQGFCLLGHNVVDEGNFSQRSVFRSATHFFLDPGSDAAKPFASLMAHMAPRVPQDFKELRIWNRLAEQLSRIKRGDENLDLLNAALQHWAIVAPSASEAGGAKNGTLQRLGKQLAQFDLAALNLLRRTPVAPFAMWHHLVAPAMRKRMKELLMETDCWEHIAESLEESCEAWWREILLETCLQLLDEPGGAAIFWRIANLSSAAMLGALAARIPQGAELVLAEGLPLDLEDQLVKHFRAVAVDRKMAVLHAALLCHAYPLASSSRQGVVDGGFDAELLEKMALQWGEFPDHQGYDDLWWLHVRLHDGAALTLHFLQQRQLFSPRTIAFAIAVCNATPDALRQLRPTVQWSRDVWEGVLAGDREKLKQVKGIAAAWIPLLTSGEMGKDQALKSLFQEVILATQMGLEYLPIQERELVWKMDRTMVRGLMENTAAGLVEMLRLGEEIDVYPEPQISEWYENILLEQAKDLSAFAMDNILRLQVMMPHENYEWWIAWLPKVTEPTAFVQRRLGEAFLSRNWANVAERIFDVIWKHDGRFLPCLVACRSLLGLQKQLEISNAGKVEYAALTESNFWYELEWLLKDCFKSPRGMIKSAKDTPFADREALVLALDTTEWPTFMAKLRMSNSMAGHWRVYVFTLLEMQRRDDPLVQHLLKYFNDYIKVPMETPYRILFLSANVPGMVNLAVHREKNNIETQLLRTAGKGHFKLRERADISPIDLPHIFLEMPANTVHFSGHGADGINDATAVSGIYMLDRNYERIKIPIAALTNTFRLAQKRNPNLHLVVLNACYSRDQAESISKLGLYVIGMSRQISDPAAIEFSASLYQGLGNGLPVEDAFEQACNYLALLQDQTSPQNAYIKPMAGQSEVPELWLNGERRQFLSNIT